MSAQACQAARLDIDHALTGLGEAILDPEAAGAVHYVVLVVRAFRHHAMDRAKSHGQGNLDILKRMFDEADTLRRQL